jgi:hypothetical protein
MSEKVIYEVIDTSQPVLGLNTPLYRMPGADWAIPFPWALAGRVVVEETNHFVIIGAFTDRETAEICAQIMTTTDEELSDAEGYGVREEGSGDSEAPKDKKGEGQAREGLSCCAVHSLAPDAAFICT